MNKWVEAKVGVLEVQEEEQVWQVLQRQKGGGEGGRNRILGVQRRRNDVGRVPGIGLAGVPGWGK